MACLFMLYCVYIVFLEHLSFQNVKISSFYSFGVALCPWDNIYPVYMKEITVLRISIQHSFNKWDHLAQRLKFDLVNLLFSGQVQIPLCSSTLFDVFDSLFLLPSHMCLLGNTILSRMSCLLLVNRVCV